MPEELEEQAEQQFDLGRYMDVVRRRYMHFLIPLFVGWLLVWGSSWLLTPRYKSGTLILVDQPTVPNSLVAPTIGDDQQNQLQNLTQQILSRTRLLTIIDKLGLYGTQAGQLTPDEEIDLMRKNIDIELVRDAQNQGISAFRIYYTASDPHTAQAVTNELSKLFIQENSKERQRDAESTTKFIANQVALAQASLTEQDAKVRQFQAAHRGELPDQQATNLQILSGLQAQLQNDQDSLNTAKQQGAYYRSLLEQYKSAGGTTTTASGEPAAVAAVDQKLATLNAQLAELRTRYTERYPEVQNLEGEIARTKAERKSLIAGFSKQSGANTGATKPLQTGGDTAPQQQLQSQIQANQIDIANRKQTIAALQKRIDEYQSRLNDAPLVAQQLSDLSRGYDQSKANFNDLLKKQNEAQMASSIAQMQGGDRFTVLDPPDLPNRPDYPNRLKMCAAGVGAGVALGLLVVFVLELVDDRMHSEREINEVVGAQIFSEIPEIINQTDERKRKRRLVLRWAMSVLVFGAILCGSVFSYLHT